MPQRHAKNIFSLCLRVSVADCNKIQKLFHAELFLLMAHASNRMRELMILSKSG